MFEELGVLRSDMLVGSEDARGPLWAWWGSFPTMKSVLESLVRIYQLLITFVYLWHGVALLLLGWFFGGAGGSVCE